MVPVALSVTVVTLAALVIGLASGLGRPPAPRPAPFAESPAVSQVLAYALTWRGPDLDPSIDVAGQSVKASNYRGVPIDGVTYFYNLAPRPSYDPLARGVVTADQIRVVAVVGNPPERVMIYTIP